MTDPTHASTLKCPICGAPLRPATKNGVHSHVCEEHGAWLQRDEFEKALRTARRGSRALQSSLDRARRKGVMSSLFWGQWSLLDDGSAPSRRNRSRRLPSRRTDAVNSELVREGARQCPMCGETMAVEAQHDIILDVCEEHGIWFDTDELEGLIARRKNRTRLRTRRQLKEAERRGKVDGLFWGIFAFLR